MNPHKTYLLSLPLQWLFIAIVVSGFVGCTNTPAQRQEAVERAFTNQNVRVKSTTYLAQYIVQCEDGSIWEVKTTDNGGFLPAINYKNCLFDALYRLPTRPLPPPLPPLPLEKVDTNGVVIP